VGDICTLTYNDGLDPQSILSGWNGTSQGMTVRLRNNSNCPGSATGNDSVVFYNSANSSQLPLGCIDLAKTSYAGSGCNSDGSGCSFTSSTMVQNGARTTMTITLGGSDPTGANQASGTGSLILWPNSAAYDRAGNAMTTSSVTEGGALDGDF
jgi:hypothetical protein